MTAESPRKILENLQLTEIKDLDHELGRGAYGIVKEVSVHGTECAAKVIHKILLQHATKEEYEKVQKMFIQECVQCSNLRHPNLVQFLGIHYPNKTESLPWLILEKLYASLTNILAKYSENDILFARKISILQDVSLGIQYLHSKNIVHRDISSNNILLTKHLSAKLSDFGVAKMIDPEHATKHTQVPGTLIFMPPESTSVNPQYHTPVDIFSFGCVTIHIMSHQWPVPEDQVTKDMKALTEIERRKKYLSEVKTIKPLMMLVTTCLKNSPEQRPTVSEVVKKLQSIVTEESLFVYDNVIELEKQLKSGKIVETVSVKRDVALPMSCHKSRCVKLTTKVVAEKSIKLSESFSPVMENIKLPKSIFTDGSHFIFSHDRKLLVLCDMKKYYNSNGRYVVLFDLQSDTLDFIDKEVRRLCQTKDGFVALKRDQKSSGRDFYTMDPSCRKWANSSIQPLPTFDIKYPDMFANSSMLFVISGNSLQVFVFDLQQWFKFILVITDGKIEASLTTTYAVMNDRLYICYTDKAELYYIDMEEINDAIARQSQPARLMTLCPVRMLRPVNFIVVHEDYLVALHINTQDKSIYQAWYYSEGCDHWHVITSSDDAYIDEQWFTMEGGKAAVAKMSASWSIWNGWDITIKIHQVDLNED